MATATKPARGWTRIVGKVYANVTIENQEDVIDVRRGRLRPGGVRSVTLLEMLVDTGASHVCLPESMIRQLALPLSRTVVAETAAGTIPVSIYEFALVTVEGDDGTRRSGVFEVAALPEGTEPLLGVLALEGLGITPDVVNHQLLLLPERPPGTRVTV